MTAAMKYFHHWFHPWIFDDLLFHQLEHASFHHSGQHRVWLKLLSTANSPYTYHSQDLRTILLVRQLLSRIQNHRDLVTFLRQMDFHKDFPIAFKIKQTLMLRDSIHLLNQKLSQHF